MVSYSDSKNDTILGMPAHILWQKNCPYNNDQPALGPFVYFSLEAIHQGTRTCESSRCYLFVCLVRAREMDIQLLAR